MPTEEEIKNCQENGINCEYCICDECEVNSSNE